MGTFAHEAAAVDPVRRVLYLTEDDPEGRFYRFTPTTYPDLSAGTLEAAIVASDGAVTWVGVDPAEVKPRPAGSTAFDGSEGIWYYSGHVYFTTKGDNRVWDLDAAAQCLSVLYDAAEIGPDTPLTGGDNVVVSSAGDLYVAEDGGNLEIVVITAERQVAPVLRITDQNSGSLEEGGTELTGPAFSPDGRRLYFSSQLATTGGGPGPGITYEITGPFRAAVASASAAPPRAAPTMAAPAAVGRLAATGADPSWAVDGLGLLGLAAAGAAVVEASGEGAGQD